LFLDFWDVLRLVIPLAMLPVVAARSQPAAAIAWMLLFCFSPGLDWSSMLCSAATGFCGA